MELRRKEKLLYCTSCKKSQHDIWHLIASSSENICDECVDLCQAVLEHEWKKRNGTEEWKH